MPSPVVIVGGSGRIGSLVLDRLLERGTQVRVISRNPRGATALAARGVQVFRGDVREADTLRPALEGAAAVLFSVEPGTAASGSRSPKATMYDGVRNVLSGLGNRPEGPHFVLISQIYVTRKDHPINSWGGMLDWRLAGENEVRASGLPYTVLRPGWFTDGHRDGQGVRLEQGDTGEGAICVQDLADACVEGLTDPAARNKTFELFNEPGSAPDWTRLLTGLRPDSGLVRAGAR